MSDLSAFKKRKDYLICVDSDGCAMDTMDIKHIRCFGPCMVEQWNLQPWEQTVLKRWNDINLYTLTRGINRFKALAIALKEVDGQYCPIEDLFHLTEWVDNSKELSNDALKAAIRQNPDSISLQKALIWSEAVNASIKELPEEFKQPFEGVKEALALAHQKADVAIVSSANLDAVIEEWSKFGLLDHTDVVLTQNVGSKAFCISELLKKGYDADKVLMCGDAPGDKQAARTNGVLFYPILVGKEKESWEEFAHRGLSKLMEGTYKGDYQQAKIDQFINNLK